MRASGTCRRRHCAGLWNPKRSDYARRVLALGAGKRASGRAHWRPSVRSCRRRAQQSRNLRNGYDDEISRRRAESLVGGQRGGGEVVDDGRGVVRNPVIRMAMEMCSWGKTRVRR